MFIGRDGSLAFVTGIHNDKEIRDISLLTVEQLKLLNYWVQFYNENYIYKGIFNTVSYIIIFN